MVAPFNLMQAIYDELGSRDANTTPAVTILTGLTAKGYQLQALIDQYREQMIAALLKDLLRIARRAVRGRRESKACDDDTTTVD